MPFRLIVKRAQVVGGSVHRHVNLVMDNRICGLLVLHPSDWDQMRLIAEVVEMEITDETLPSAATTATQVK